MVTDWGERGRWNRAARLQAQYVESRSSFNRLGWLSVVVVLRDLLSEAVKKAKELGTDEPFSSLYRELRKNQLCRTASAALSALVNSLAVSRNLDGLRDLQSLHLRAIEDTDQNETLPSRYQLAEFYLNTWLEGGLSGESVELTKGAIRSARSSEEKTQILERMCQILTGAGYSEEVEIINESWQDDGSQSWALLYLGRV